MALRCGKIDFYKTIVGEGQAANKDLSGKECEQETEGLSTEDRCADLKVWWVDGWGCRRGSSESVCE